MTKWIQKLRCRLDKSKFMTNNSSKQVIWTKNRRGQNIYGELYLPSNPSPAPLVIYSHGYGYTMPFIDSHALVESGIATFEFDFCGGSPESRSDGSSIDMSVMTEADDLDAVLNKLQSHPAIDRNKIYLSGGSQGGFVSIVIGVRRQKDIQGMILYCPALVIGDFEQYELHGARMPERYCFGNMIVGKRYVDDLKNYDVYAEMKKFTKSVLYYQGSADEMVPITYAYHAEKSFPNVQLKVIPGASHMLTFGHETELFEEMKQFILNE